MATGEDFLFRPIIAGCMKLESLTDGSVDLELVASMNDALDVQQENERRLSKK